MSTCRYLELVEELGDGTLAPADAREVRAHLDGCEGCRHRHEATSRLLSAAAALGDLEPPAGIFERALAEAGPDLGRPRATGRLARLRGALAGRSIQLGLVGAVAASLALFAWGRGDAPAPTAPASAVPWLAARELGTAAIEAAAAAPAPYEDALGDLAPLLADARRTWAADDAERIDRALAAADAVIARARTDARSLPGDLTAAQALNDALRVRLELQQAALLDAPTAAPDVQASLAPGGGR